MTVCKNCGAVLPDGAVTCDTCQTPIGNAAPPFAQTPPPTPSSQQPAQPYYPYPPTPVPQTISIEQLPSELRPLGAWAYFGYSLLFAIPLVGFILLIVFACGATSNVNLRNYARSFFCWLAILGILLLAAILLAAAGFINFLWF